MPLTNDRTALLKKIKNLTAAGGTAVRSARPGLGTRWRRTGTRYGRRKVRRSHYGTAELQKIAILMTDGEYNTEYDTNGVKPGSTNAGRGQWRLNHAGAQICAQP